MNIVITDHALQLLKSFGWHALHIEAPKTIKSSNKHGTSVIEESAKVLEGIPHEDHDWDIHLVSGITVYTSKHLIVKHTLTIDEVHDGDHSVLIAKGYEANIND